MISTSVALLTSDEFDAMRLEWNDLLHRSERDVVFLRWEWIHTWWSIFKANRQLFILAARREGRLVGIAPLYAERGPWGARRLRICSDDLSPDYMDFIVERGQEQDIARHLWKGLLQHPSWDALFLDDLHADAWALSDPASRQPYHGTVERSEGCPFIGIQGSFADYFSSRTQLNHFTFDKKFKKLTDKHGGRYHTTDNEEAVDKGLDVLFSLHEMRAREENRHTAFLDAPVKRFHHELARQFLREKILDLQLLYAGETPISAVYSFNYQKKVFMYQMGLDPQWKKWSAGGVLVYLAIQKAFRAGFEEYDFLKGEESYKRLWTDTQHEQRRLTLYNKTPRGLLHQAGAQGMSAARRIKRRLTGM